MEERSLQGHKENLL